MKGLLKHPAFNAVCISLFSAFYGFVFIGTAAHYEYSDTLYYLKGGNADGFWPWWARFLESGGHGAIGVFLVLATAVLVILLLTRRHPLDEYHIAILTACLVVSIVLVCVAIAIFFLAVLSAPNGIVEKFTLFIVIHWVTVVCANYVFVLKCR
jgi:hypothetical protein